IGGYGSGEIIAYYLLTMVARAFSSMPGLASGIARQVRDGEIKKFLIQPIDLMSYLLAARVAHKLVYYVVATGPFALVFFLCRDYFPGWPEPSALAAFVLSLVLGFALGFFLEASMGLVAFWFLEVSSLIFIYMMINYFLSGHMIPLDWLGEFGRWVQFLPFKYLAYFPAAVMLGKIPQEELLGEMLLELIWILVLLLLNRVAFARGVRRYGAFGG
ncbi:MAG: ABC-2 family transporter protein, partial [Planctomycetaceae bacterium]|nr:ABC-2 family transporter protein [Planctomycetaceae bacterium]